MLLPLHLAVAEYEPEQLSRLLSLGTNIDEIDSDGNTALMLALSFNLNTYYYRPLVDAGASLTVANKQGMNSLMIALDKCHPCYIVELLGWLRDAGVAPYVDESVDSGRLALLYAVFTDDGDKLEEVLVSGADVNARRGYGETPLTMAASVGHEAVMRVLLARGADIHVTDEGGSSAIAIAAESGCLECVRMLLERGAEPNNVGRFGRTPILEAAGAADAPEIVRLLIEYGADIHAADNLRGDALSMAAWRGNENTVRELLEYGAGADRQSLQCAYCACFTDNGQNCAPILLAAGAAIGIREAIAMNDVAKVKQMLAIEEIDVNAYGDPPASLLSAAVWSICDPEIIKAILQHGADVNANDLSMYSAHSPVTNTDNEHVLSLLLEACAEVNAAGESGNTPLMNYSWGGCIEAVNLVLKRKANVNAQNDDGQTALMLAARRGAVEVVKLLLVSGADVTVRDRQQRTALMQAVIGGSDESVKLLVLHGARISDRDESGATALQFAQAWRFDVIVELLVSSGARE